MTEDNVIPFVSRREIEIREAMLRHPSTHRHVCLCDAITHCPVHDPPEEDDGA